MRVFRLHALPALAVVPLLLAACGGAGTGAGVTPTATASIEIIGTPAPAGGMTTSGSSGTAASAAALTISTTGSSTSVGAAVTAATTGAAYTVTGTGNVGLRLRQTPNGAKITDIPAGSVVTALGDPPQQAGGYTWLHVKTAKGQEGWVATKYLAGGPTATPLPGG